MQLSKRKRAARSHVRPGAGTATADGGQGTVLLAVEEVLASERRHADAARAAADKASALQHEVRMLEVGGQASMQSASGRLAGMCMHAVRSHTESRPA